MLFDIDDGGCATIPKRETVEIDLLRGVPCGSDKATYKVRAKKERYQ